MNNNKFIIAILLFVLLMAGCGKADNNISDNKVTMAEEISADISENVVPIEATYYSSISFNIPEGMVVSEENVENRLFYLAESSEDYSFISYQRRENTGNISCDTMSLDDFKSAFVDQLGVTPVIKTFIREEKANYSKITIKLSYSVTGINYTCFEYVFITDKYIFTLAFCQDNRFDWVTKFEKSVESISVENTVGNIIDRITPAISKTEEVVDGVSLIEESVSEDGILKDKNIQN